MSLFNVNTNIFNDTKQSLYLKMITMMVSFVCVAMMPVYIGIYFYPEMIFLCSVLSIIIIICCSYGAVTLLMPTLENAKTVHNQNMNLQAFLSDLNEAIIALSQGHIHTILSQKYQGNLDDTAQAFNASLEEISTIVYSVKNISENLSSAGHLIANKSTDLAMRAEEQAICLQQTTATMEEISKTIKQNADNSQKANELSAISVNKATSGNHIVRFAIDSMAKVEKNAKRIRDIVKLIDDIAAQTNLLALNAAVEAARAGDSGRGFGIVASEVRILAQRTKDAALDIHTIISNSSSDIDECVLHVTQTSTALNDIVTAIHAVENIIRNIATSSQEQAIATAEISKTFIHIDDTIQHMTAISDECAQTSTVIKSHIDDLIKAIRFFKLPFVETQSLHDTLQALKQEEQTKLKNIIYGIHTSQNEAQQNLLKQVNKNWSAF